MNRSFFHTGFVSIPLLSLLSLGLVSPVMAENIEQTRQLIATKRCPQCDLSDAGLVFAKLEKADLKGANLAGANLSRADLRGADLRGADLTGATLFGANLMGAKLDRAQLVGTDLRNAYVAGVSFDGAKMDYALLQGAIGLTAAVGQSDDFYRWAVEDAQNKNYSRAITNFTESIQRNQKAAPSYLGRALAKAQIGDRDGAISDGQFADQLFTAQGRTDNAKVAQTLVKELQTPPEKPAKSGGSNFGQALMGVVGTVLQIFLGF